MVFILNYQRKSFECKKTRKFVTTFWKLKKKSQYGFWANGVLNFTCQISSIWLERAISEIISWKMAKKTFVILEITNHEQLWSNPSLSTKHTVNRSNVTSCSKWTHFFTEPWFSFRKIVWPTSRILTVPHKTYDYKVWSGLEQFYKEPICP